jgi:hypothetical protein
MEGKNMQERLSKDLWQAVNFAASMIKKGQRPQDAVRISARYYKVDYREVAKHCGKRSKYRRKKRNKWT